jgi:hypothetical protein
MMLAVRVAAGEPPRFEDYPVSQVFHGTPVSPVLSTRHARAFRTELRRQAASGPNFAGHYTLARWGCGAGCVTVAVIDALSGEVWFAPFTFQDAVKDRQIVCDHASDFKITSRLFVAQGEIDGRVGSHYFTWVDGHLSLVYFDQRC